MTPFQVMYFNVREASDLEFDQRAREARDLEAPELRIEPANDADDVFSHSPVRRVRGKEYRARRNSHRGDQASLRMSSATSLGVRVHICQ